MQGGITATAVTSLDQDIEMIVYSEVMRKLMAMVERVARGSAAVLITGETGSGKELVARSLHHKSLRSSKPWVDINCAALPELLVESELFGYEKGAFSGADSPKPGMFELANNGTLFLDEVGELEPKTQVKLLRVLDGAPYYRLGGHTKVSVDVRIIAATNQPLDEAVKTGRFRSDLFHRLSQIQLRVPPLRERPEDVVAIAQYLLAQSHPMKTFSESTVQLLRMYNWPGNVRELRNVVLQAATISAHDEIGPADLPAAMTSGQPSQPADDDEENENAALDVLEKQAILQTLARTGGHQGMAAEQLGISRRTLSRKLKQYNIEARKSEVKPLGTLSGHEKLYFRASVAMPVSITTKDAQYNATAVNVSAGGLALQDVRDPFRLPEAFEVDFTLPETAETFRAHAQIVWADVQGKAGIRFLDLLPERQDCLRHWLKRKQIDEGWTIDP
jgi:transcriptional regulator with PAS, ATPase and Fis domain